MKTKDAIKAVLEKSMCVTAGYKAHAKDWYSDVVIHIYHNKCMVRGGVDGQFENIDEGIQFYIDEVLSSKNVGYVWNRLKDKGILTDDIFDFLGDNGKFRDEKYQKIYDEAVKAEKKLINAENKAEKEE